MLKRPITYTNFNEEEVTEEFYFNLSNTEMIEMEMGHEEGLSEYLTNLLKSGNKAKIVSTFKDIVLSAYGQKSEDGKRFVKSDEIRETFSQTAAFDTLLLELFTNENAVTDFIKGVIPKDLVAKLDHAQLQQDTAKKLSTMPFAKEVRPVTKPQQPPRPPMPS